jgi:hypothetical protein
LVFKGWQLNDTLITNEDEWKSLGFDGGNLDYNFYAVLEHETYKVRFYDGDGNEFDSQDIVYGEFASAPSTLPTKAYSEEEEKANLYGGYAFKYYALNPNATSAITLSAYPITSDTDFYAIFTKVDDLRTVVNYDLFDFAEYNYTETAYGDESYNETGYRVTPKEGIILSGKITIPATYNKKNVVSMSGFMNQKMTHIFFEKNQNGNTTIKEIPNSCFGNESGKYAENLKFFEFVDSIRFIGNYAFRSVKLNSERYNLPKSTYYIGRQAFNEAFYSPDKPVTINIGANVKYMGFYAFANSTKIASGSTIIIGEPN